MTLDQKLAPRGESEKLLFDLAAGIFDTRYEGYRDNTSFKKEILKKEYQRFILSAYRYERVEWKDEYISGIKGIYNFYTGGYKNGRTL